MALHPAEFAGGEEAPDGSGWRIAGVDYPTNPRFGLPEWTRDMLTIWLHCRRGDFGGGLLPAAGGVGDQAALMLDALGMMDAAEAAIRKERGGDDQH